MASSAQMKGTEMKLHQESAELYIPDGLPEEAALARTTHLCIAAHQDDIEIMAAAPILECFQQPDAWFTGVVVTDGRGSPRNGAYSNFTDEQMRQVRFKEQRKAAFVGDFAAQVMLDYPSQVIKDAGCSDPVRDLTALLRAARPQFVYTHNLFDKHDTHVAVALRVITALRQLNGEERPAQLIGCEVWRSLDWVVDSDKVMMDVSTHENLQAALLGVFDSQIAGGKRYDLASLGRRRANATYLEAHGADNAVGLSYGVDMTALMSPNASIEEFVARFLLNFQQDVTCRLKRMSA